MSDDRERIPGAKPDRAAADAQETGDGAAEAGKQGPADDGLKPGNVNPLAPPINVEGGG